MRVGRRRIYGGVAPTGAMVERVLVPVDDSELADRALEFALETFRDASIDVLYVVPVSTSIAEELVGLTTEAELDRVVEERAAPVLDRARQLATEHGREVNTAVAVGNPSRVIADRAGDADLVVIGGHGRRIPSRILLGSVTEKVVRRSPVPVTVVR